jgi:CspA family cold shock protein
MLARVDFSAEKGAIVRRKGRVKWFDENRGVGIIRDGSGRELPVRYADIDEEGYRSLAEGERVEFDIEEDAGGIRARCVRRLPVDDD